MKDMIKDMETVMEKEIISIIIEEINPFV